MGRNHLTLFAFLFAVAGCGGDTKGSDPDASVAECQEGQLLACACEEGVNGYAFCEDGTWGECVCDDDGEFPMFCGMCHGDWDYPAPPVDTHGNTETSVVTVGAHRVHLASSDWHRKVECSDCHSVPTGIETPGHVDESPAELSFSEVPTAAGATPLFDRTAAKCSGVYCHGATAGPGGSNTEPVWTNVDGTQAVCGSCHGLPPGGTHPAEDDCSDCHGNVVDVERNFIDASLHIDGKTDFTGDGVSCITCHGSEENPAPPVDTNGNSDPTIVTVGAHQSHLGASDWHRDVQCDDCHEVPESLSDCHNDGPPAELTWSDLSSADGASPSFDEGSARCTNTYCHGATLSAGGTNPDPHWNVVASGEVVCGDCHGIPPCDGHPGSGPCAPCHDQVYDGTDFVNPQLHIDGEIQVIEDLPCGACHGMPPTEGGHPDNDDCGLCHGMVWDDDDWVDEDLHDNGEVNVSTLACNICHGNPPTPGNQSFAGGGGAHGRHVTDLGMACSTCHGHDGTGASHAEDSSVLQANVDIVFDTSVTYSSGTTMTNGGTTAFDHNGGSPTCNVGCHNPTIGDTSDLDNDAAWTDNEIACSDCHEAPGLAPPTNHDVDGTDIEIRGACATCHDVSAHAMGTVVLADPDTSDGIDPTASGAVASDQCKTCHDGGSGTWFGGTPGDLGDSWTAPRAHEAAGVSCDTCHDHHGTGAGGALVANAEEDGCAGAACHDGVVTEMGLSGGGTRHHVVDSEQSGGALECVTCHDPHAVDDSPWQPLTDPDDGSLVAAADVPGDDFTTSDSSTNVFCLDCHDGSWTDAANVSTELADSGSAVTGFVANGGPTAGNNLHYSHVNTHGFACTHCHNAHSNTGTAGTDRGRLLYDFIYVNTFPYMGKGTCQLTGGPTGCHH